MSYMKKQFFEELKKRGVSISYKTLLRYEQLGIVQRPNNGWRIYDEKHVDEYVAAIKAYREAGVKVNIVNETLQKEVK